MQHPKADERDPQTYAIIGAAMAVHAELGCGFLEEIYQEALAIEMGVRHIEFRREVELPVFYRGERLLRSYRADFICYGQIIVELKAIKQLGDLERAQTINYLKATGFTRALLINFGAVSLEFERLVRGYTG